MEAEQEINRILEEYADTVRRICYSYLKNYHDTEDIFQTVFLKFLKRKKPFDSREHEKAWFIRVTINSCKDQMKSFFRKNVTFFAEAEEPCYLERQDLGYVRDAVVHLPPKYKDVIYLFYFEEYTAVEIAKILGKNENTIYTRLKRGKELLKNKLGGDYFGE